MIRTLIEVSGDNSWEHEQQLGSALDQIGYERKDPGHDRWVGDLLDSLRQKGMRPEQLVEEYRAALKPIAPTGESNAV